MSVKEPQDATCVKPRTGYVFRLGGSLSVWKSKLQTLVALSTVEAEYAALSACMRELIPLRSLLMELQCVFSFQSSVAVVRRARYLRTIGTALRLFVCQ